MNRIEITVLQIKAKYFNLIKIELERSLPHYSEDPHIERLLNIKSLTEQCEIEILNFKNKLK